MIRSELILPIRWYNDLFNQERFGIDHKPLCEKLLVYKPETLPSFQVKTPSSMLSPSSFRMRNVCVDAEQNYYNRWTEKAANLQEPDALAAFGPYPTQDYIGSPTPITIFQNVCNVFKSVKLDPADYTQNGQPTSMLLPVVNCKQRFTITFDAFKSPSNLFNVAIYNGAILVGVINKPGTYTFDFKTTFNPITILFANFDATEDYFEISYIQSQVLDIFCQTNDIRDIDLDEYLPNLTLFDLANGESVYVFCKPDNNIPIPPGDYYYYLK